MPAEVRQLLNLLSVGVSFGLGSTSDILTCMGVSGFFNILLLWTLLPAGCVLLIVIGCVVHLAYRCELSRRGLLQTALPLITRTLFILYPQVTNIAFESFSCYEFDNRTSAYLVADVSVPCTTQFAGSSEAHDRITTLAYIAIGVYPIGCMSSLDGTRACSSLSDRPAFDSRRGQCSSPLRFSSLPRARPF